MLKVVDVIGVASTGAYEGDASLVTRTKIVRMGRLGFWPVCLEVVRVAASCNTPAAEARGSDRRLRLPALPLTFAPDFVEAILDEREPME